MLSMFIFHTLDTKSYFHQACFVQVLPKRTGCNSLWPLTQGVINTLVYHGSPFPHAELVLQVATPWAFAFRVPCNVSEIWTLDNLPCNFDSLRCEHSDPSHRPFVIHLGYRCCHERLHEYTLQFCTMLNRTCVCFHTFGSSINFQTFVTLCHKFS